MKYLLRLVAVLLIPNAVIAQSYPQYTMFMYNKLIYNPAYAGNKNMTQLNAAYRNQWSGIDGAPRGCNVSLDGPIGAV